ncbi:30S ribosomal protein S5 alanine N-acetyltransferase [Tatumella sp. TA1]|uniref:ribosomal protein S5-alanine N-acetyltransferase n=1 Tax=Rosenbergiella collisarenosi TaxID=1544695 RepID=UPI0008F91255|nr:ribosomal protein S5-alanine N-acetyltransferase [Rosenbergiella collisarenosi]MBT0721151.1 ribosomal protein S5-alanine N-acetyltransferase [Rosenbergiella collisarenosi]QGX91171.1 30S ribosomal protein S5 alanine N-acetyltransferase [Tatumella sp. TA1]
MFGYRSSGPRLSLTSPRMQIRTVAERDGWLLTDYYQENRDFLMPWEPLRDESYFHHHGWDARLHVMTTQQKQGDAFYFLLMDPAAQQVWGVANFTQVIRGCFQACYLGYSLAGAQQGNGLMHEALTTLIPVLQKQQQLHRIMANYMPRNQRSGALLARLGFEKEGYARDYLKINGRWEDHVLTALVTPTPD